MLILPAFYKMPNIHLYRDSADPQLLYGDLLEPAPVRGDSATRWLPIPNAEAYLVGEVRFAADQEGFGNVPELVKNQRLLPMPWGSTPVYVWYQKEDGVELLAQGETSGFGQSNTVFNGTAPLGAMIAPVLVAAELNCPAWLVEWQVEGVLQPAAILSALPHAKVGAQAEWSATLSEALVTLLDGMLAAGDLTLNIQGGRAFAGDKVAAKDELRQLALLEWAHRLGAQLAPTVSLAAPAALVRLPDQLSVPMLDINWRIDSRVPLRTVRLLRPKQMGRSVPKP